MSREQVTSQPTVVLTSSSTSKQADLGSVIWDNVGNAYRYVQNIAADAIAIADGTCVYQTVTWGVVTPDIAGGSGLGDIVVGVGVGAIAAGSYGYVQVSGYHDKVKTDGTMAAGNFMMGSATDGEAIVMANGEEEAVFGQALAADTTTEPHSCPAILKIL